MLFSQDHKFTGIELDHIQLNGNATFGNASSDTLVIGSRITGNINPTHTDTFDLGTSSLKWQSLYLSTLMKADTISTRKLTVTGTATVSMTVTASLYADSTRRALTSNYADSTRKAVASVFADSSRVSVTSKACSGTSAVATYADSARVAVNAKDVDTTGTKIQTALGNRWKTTDTVTYATTGLDVDTSGTKINAAINARLPITKIKYGGTTYPAETIREAIYLAGVTVYSVPYVTFINLPSDSTNSLRITLVQDSLIVSILPADTASVRGKYLRYSVLVP